MIEGAELDLCPSDGWMSSPEFNTLIKTLRSGRERRKPLQQYVKHRYTLPYENIKRSDYLQYLKSLFLVARGSAESFLAKDYSDHSVEGALFGLGDGSETEFDLSVTVNFGVGSYTRLILYPVDPVFYVEGVEATATFNPVTKKVVFDTAPADADQLSWSGEFRVLVRFASDVLPMSINGLIGNELAMSGSVDLVEVWE